MMGQWQSSVHDYAGQLLRMGRKAEALAVLNNLLTTAPFDYEAHLQLMENSPDPTAATNSAQVVFKRAEDFDEISKAARFLGIETPKLETLTALSTNDTGLEVILIPIAPCNPWLLDEVAHTYEGITDVPVKIRRLDQDWVWRSPDPANETVLESARLDFPNVNAETQFLVQWIVNSNQVVGLTDVLVYPTNLFHELKSLLGEGAFGVLDPNDELKPLLKQNGVEYLDLGGIPLEDFTGKLAIIGPFHSQEQVREGLARTIQRIARKGVAVVWLQPPPSPKIELKPSFYTVLDWKGAVVVVQPELVAHLSDDPRSQLNLIHFCKLALNPAPLQLPNLSPQP